MSQPRIDPDEFENDAFIKANITFVEKYAELRVRGVYKVAAFRRVFGAANCEGFQAMHERIDNLEASEGYNEVFERLLKSIPVDQMLNERRALHAYLDIAHNPNYKESVRVAAIKEAAVLAGLTTIDEGGRTRKTPTLADLYDTVMPALEAKANGAPANPLH